MLHVPFFRLKQWCQLPRKILKYGAVPRGAVKIPRSIIRCQLHHFQSRRMRSCSRAAVPVFRTAGDSVYERVCALERRIVLRMLAGEHDTSYPVLVLVVLLLSTPLHVRELGVSASYLLVSLFVSSLIISLGCTFFPLFCNYRTMTHIDIKMPSNIPLWIQKGKAPRLASAPDQGRLVEGGLQAT